MFNVEQLDIDTSFYRTGPSAALGEVRAKLGQYRFAVVEGQDTYVISAPETGLFGAWDENTRVDEWIKRAGLAPSRVCTLAQLTEGEGDGERPCLIKDNQGSFQGVVTPSAFIRFLTRANRSLNSYLSTPLDTVNDAVTAVDREGRVIIWNRTAEEVYAIKKQDIIGRKIGEHFAKESIMLHNILDEGRIVRQAYHQPAPGKHVLINASPIIENNKIIGGIATEKDISRIVHLNEELYSALPLRIEQERPFSSIIGMGPAFKRSITAAQKFAQTGAPVLLTGEPGTGKEMLAQAIHYGGDRKNGPFLTLHCGAIPGGLLESELFGYQGGAFTSGENQGKAGKLEMAEAGTLLLEEIGRMPLDIQLKPLDYLRSGTFRRVGGETDLQADTRIIATSTASLQQLMAQGSFSRSCITS
ncbi:sigma 54-interacting transcriptional regulator [Paenibacillus sp. P25]|nr:sigma 54-interacting transcriptional regulator [Paenibacillus sp. P25]